MNRDGYADASVDQLISERARNRPDAIAVVGPNVALTYTDLDTRANKLAWWLRGRGVTPESRVAVRMERTPELLTVLLAILKARAAYVPIDTADPAERVQALMEDAGTTLLIAERTVSGELSDIAHRPVYFEDIRQAIEEYPAADVPSGARRDNLAYVTYTSGSTGKPKGVAITHGAIIDLVLGSDYVCLDESDVVAQAANISFDASTFEVWGPLLNGASLVIVDQLTTLSPSAFGALLHDHSVTTLFLTTALFNIVVRANPYALNGLKHLLFGGERVDAKAVACLLDTTPPERLLHMYGPTEATTFASWHPIKYVSELAETIPIGSAVSGTTIHLLDEYLSPVPAGQAGEIFIGGTGLARGYLGRPDLTAERFIPSPMPGSSGERLYRTGDFAQRNGAGELEFLGRADDQVKLRGHRIELDEVSAALKRYPAVDDATVLVREDVPGERILVGYVACPAGDAPSPAELREFTRQILPEYMCPSILVILGHLPLGPTGKVDRQALLSLPAEEPMAAVPGAGPSTPAESAVALAASELLNLQSVSLDDNFFDLGGHSLLATRLVARLRETLGVELPIPVVNFETLRNVAATADHLAEVDTSEPVVPPMKPALRSGPLPLSFSQERIWFLTTLFDDNVSYNTRFSIRFRGEFRTDLVRRAFEELVRRHEVLRTTFPLVDGTPAQVIQEPWAVDIPLVDLTILPPDAREEELEWRVFAEGARPFNLNRLPLIRWTLYRLAADDHVLLQVEHHLLHDGWSWSVLMHEFQDLYQAFLHDEPSPLPPLKFHFADFAIWQRGWMHGEALRSELDYWRRKLDGCPPMLELPTDRPRPAVQSIKGRCLRMQLPADLVNELRKVSEQARTSQYTTMLTAFAVLLYCWTQETDIPITTTFANRRLRDAEGLVGMIVNTVVLRMRVDPGQRFDELLKDMHDLTMEAHAHQDIPFHTLIAEMDLPRSLSYIPFYSVGFDYGDYDSPSLEFDSGLRGEARVGLDNGSAKNDMNLMVIPRDPAFGSVPVCTLLWEYCSDLFEEATAARMLRNYCQLLDALTVNPQSRLDALTRGIRPDLPQRVPAAPAAPGVGTGSRRQEIPPQPEHQPVSPRTAAEQALAKIWCEVLNVGEVGAFDDFFELGGHSMLAMMVWARLGAVFHAKVPMRVLFDYPRLDQMSAVLESAAKQASDLPDTGPLMWVRGRLADGSAPGRSEES